MKPLGPYSSQLTALVQSVPSSKAHPKLPVIVTGPAGQGRTGSTGWKQPIWYVSAPLVMFNSPAVQVQVWHSWNHFATQTQESGCPAQWVDKVKVYIPDPLSKGETKFKAQKGFPGKGINVPEVVPLFGSINVQLIGAGGTHGFPLTSTQPKSPLMVTTPGVGQGIVVLSP